MASEAEADDERLVRAALGGDGAALRSLVKALAPVIQGQVERGLQRRRRGARQRDVRQEVADMTQEVFVALFADGARALRGWDPARGLSLRGFARLVADREVASILRSGRRTPWRDDPTEAEALDQLAEGDGELDDRLGSREMLAALLDRLREALSPYGMHLFQLLLVEELPVAEVCASQNLTPDAVYAWRSRLTKLARKLGQELLDEQPSARPEPLPAGGSP